MFYIFNKNGKCISSCDIRPCETDLASRGEYLIEHDGDCQLGYTDNNGVPTPPVVVPPTPEQQAATARDKRDGLLLRFDRDLYRNQFFWSTLTPEQQAERMAYRQALLDVPQQSGFPDAVIWPASPTL